MKSLSVTTQMKATGITFLLCCLFFVTLQNETWERSRMFILCSTERQGIKLQVEISHDVDDDDDDDVRRRR